MKKNLRGLGPMNGKLGQRSASQNRRDKIQVKLSKDADQMQFYTTVSGNLDTKANSSKYATIEQKGIDPYAFVTCPFCLSRVEFRRFLVSGKKGFNKERGRCPECDNGLMFKTLQFMKGLEAKEAIKEESAKKYAEWVFEYKRSGFFKKIKFDNWKERLKMMGWSFPFWARYKELRGDTQEEKDNKAIEDLADAYEAQS